VSATHRLWQSHTGTGKMSPRMAKPTATFAGLFAVLAACSDGATVQESSGSRPGGSGAGEDAAAGGGAGQRGSSDASEREASAGEASAGRPIVSDAAPPNDSTIGADAPALGPIDLGSATIYSIYTPIFSSTANLRGATAQLPRIHDLGFNVIYLLPVMPIGQAARGHPSFNSPYSVRDYYAVNPSLGTDSDLVALVQAAHGLRMHVLLDAVLNHTSWDNALITQHPEYYLHSDANPTNVDSIVQVLNFADVAQLNYKTTDAGLATYMTAMLQYWIKTFDVDGFRFDSVDDPYGDGRMIPASFWQALRPALEAVKPGLLMLGEEEDPALAQAPFELDYGWQLQGIYGPGGLRQVATGGNAMLLQQTWQSQVNGYPAGMKHMTLLQEWDLDEDIIMYGGLANTMAAAVFNFTIDGVPLLFNGEEVGNDMSGVNSRRLINWGGANANTFTPFYESLLALRNANPALQQGRMTWVQNSLPSSVVSYTRSDANATFLVLVNFSGAPVTGTVTVPGANGWTDVSPTGSPQGRTHPAPPTISLVAHDFAVFRAN
jgi:cyclomaltodextrinase